MRTGRAQWRRGVTGPGGSGRAGAASFASATAPGNRRFRSGRSWALTSVLAIVLLGLLGPGAAVAAPGDILVADPDAFGGTGGVIRVDPATGARTTVSANGAPAGGPDFAEPFGLALEADGDILVSDGGAFGSAGGVIRVDPVTGSRTTVSANGAPAGGPEFREPGAVALEADGDILVADESASPFGGAVIRVDPATGARTTVSANGVPPGGPDFTNPFGLALEADGDILVTDYDAFGGGGGVIRVDPATGARATVSANDAPPGGPEFDAPFGVAVVPPPPQRPPDQSPPERAPAVPAGPAQPGCPLTGNVIVGSDADDERSGGGLSDIIFGTLGDDLLRGLGGADCLYGQHGADRLLGGRGPDRVFGGQGADRLRGGAGNDWLRDRRGRDRLVGGAGRDRINPGPGSDRVAAGPGNDRVLARGNARDTIDCGTGQSDVAIVDPLDDTSRCEQVRLP
jgi:hypothetical protein